MQRVKNKSITNANKLLSTNCKGLFAFQQPMHFIEALLVIQRSAQTIFHNAMLILIHSHTVEGVVLRLLSRAAKHPLRS
jgi:hypothetical protein